MSLRQFSRASHPCRRKAAFLPLCRGQGGQGIGPALFLVFLALDIVFASTARSLAQDSLPPAQAPVSTESTATPPARDGDRVEQTVVRPALEPPRLETAPKIDGILDEALWKDAALAEHFIQQRPYSGEAASAPTVVRVVYTDQALYLGFSCQDDNPERIVHRILGRDADLSADDYFTVVLDTYHDLQNGYFFQVNPNGARTDAVFRAEGAAGQVNRDWDGVWKAACRITSGGWQGEIEIPWRTLRFSAGSNTSMGLNFERQRRAVNEQSMWSPIERNFDILRVSQAGSLDGLDGIAPGSNILLRPYVLGKVFRGDASDEDAWSREDAATDGKVGYDLKLGLASNLTLDVTVNTDFAQVEVDDQQVNLTRFPLFFPEKREFFLENRDYFAFGSPANRAFFSRRIGLNSEFQTVPIEYGTRLTGKLARTDIGFLDLKTNGIGSAYDYRYDVGRVSRDIGRRSRVGAIVVARTADGGSVYNHVYGLDADLRPRDDLDISLYGAFSDESEKGLAGDPPSYGDQPRDGPDNGTWGGRLRYSRPLYYATYLYEVYGRDYAPRVGFLPRRDISHHMAELGITPQPNWRFLRRVESFVYGEWIDRRDSVFESRNLWLEAAGYGPGDEKLGFYLSDSFERLFEDFQLGDVVFSPGNYNFGRIGFALGSNPSWPVAMTLDGETGNYYDGFLKTLQGSLIGRWAPHLSLTLEGETHRLDRIDGPSGVVQRFDADVVRLRVEIDFSNAWSLAVFTQWNSAQDGLFSQARLHWIFGDESDFYLVFSDVRTDGTFNFAPRETDLSLKLSYSIRL